MHKVILTVNLIMVSWASVYGSCADGACIFGVTVMPCCLLVSCLQREKSHNLQFDTYSKKIDDCQIQLAKIQEKIKATDALTISESLKEKRKEYLEERKKYLMECQSKLSHSKMV